MELDTLQHILAPAASLALMAGVIIATLQFRNQQHLRELENRDARYAPMPLLDDLLSGPVLDSWPKVAPIWSGLRGEFNQPSWAEWFKFFYEEMAKRMARLK